MIDTDENNVQKKCMLVWKQLGFTNKSVGFRLLFLAVSEKSLDVTQHSTFLHLYKPFLLYN